MPRTQHRWGVLLRAAYLWLRPLSRALGHTGIICKKRFSAIFGRIIDIAAMISVICRDFGDDAAISEGIIEIIIIKGLDM